MSVYQCFCILWHLSRGDLPMARLSAILPPEMFTEGDALIRAAYLAGAVNGQKPDSGAAGGD